MNQLADFASLAQSGQELSREESYPAEILLDGSSVPLAASGGGFSDADHTLDSGGFFASYAATFRVRIALLGGTLPRVGQKLRWRRPGDVDWRQMLEIARIGDPASDGTLSLTCSAAAKP